MMRGYAGGARHLWLSSLLLCALAASSLVDAFVAVVPAIRAGASSLEAAAAATSSGSTSTSLPLDQQLNNCKSDLIRLCTLSPNKPSQRDVEALIDQLEDVGERLGVGQASSISGLLAGEWELIYSSEDDTRSSPFFWAFRKAVSPEDSNSVADQIFGITDAIPPPLKEVGPARQSIEWDAASTTFATPTATGKLVSRVQVATLGGTATSQMTTRCTILGSEGLDAVRLQIDTTKPEDSTLLKKIPLVGDYLNQQAPPFPSGQALERVRPGSSVVTMKTSFCDVGLRISRNDERPEDVYIWRRTSFGEGVGGSGGGEY